MRDGHWVKVRPSRALCGFSPSEFAGLLIDLADVAEQDKRAREDWEGRKRAPGAGAKPQPFAVRLLVAFDPSAPRHLSPGHRRDVRCA
jgi:hypothetical protein